MTTARAYWKGYLNVSLASCVPRPEGGDRADRIQRGRQHRRSGAVLRMSHPRTRKDRRASGPKRLSDRRQHVARLAADPIRIQADTCTRTDSELKWKSHEQARSHPRKDQPTTSRGRSASIRFPGTRAKPDLGCERHLRARCPHRLAYASARSDVGHHRRCGMGAAPRRADRRGSTGDVVWSHQT
jgi:hypothetical protein